jgi:hypothetical protein
LIVLFFLNAYLRNLLPVKLYLNNLQSNSAIPNLKNKINLHLNKTNNSLLITYVQSCLSVPLDVMASKHNTNIKNKQIYFT